MKDFVKKIQSFILFDSPLDMELISREFLMTHHYYLHLYPNWSLSATRKKVITNFWQQSVLYHFTAVLSLAVLLVLFFGESYSVLFVSAVWAGILSFVLLMFCYYGPEYYSNFLTNLDNIITEQEALKALQVDIKKCKRSQYSIPTLSIIFYVFCKASSCPTPASNDKSAELLTKLFGADKDKLKQNLSRIYKISSLSSKEKVEIQKGIDTARVFFEAFGLNNSNSILEQLELKLQRND